MTAQRSAVIPGRARPLTAATLVLIVAALATLPADGGPARRERKALIQLSGRPVSGIEPRIVLNDDGGAWDAASFQGRVTILNFWATWCPPCLEEIPLLEQAHRRWGERGLRVFGVTTFVDEEQADPELGRIREVLESQGVSYPVLISTEQRDWDAYLVKGLPVTVLVDRGGLPVDYALGIKGLRRILGKVEALLAASR